MLRFLAPRFLVFIFSYPLSLLVFAEESESQDVLCLTTHYPPYTIYREKQRDFVGADMQYLKQLAQKLNWNLTVLNFPWGRVKLEIEKEQFNCFFSLAFEEQRAQFLDYTSHPLHITQYGVFFQKNNKQLQQQDLAHKIVALLRGVPLAPDALKHNGLGLADIVYLDSNETLISIISTGRVDASVLNYQVGHYLLESSPYKADIDSFIMSEYQLPVYLAFRKGTQDIKLIDAALKQIAQEMQQNK